MNSRVEDLIMAIINGETVDFTPPSRVEAYLMRCLDGSGTADLPPPISRLDYLLFALAAKMTGGIVSDEDVATDEEVTEMITEVFGSPGTVPDDAVATNDEVQVVLAEVFE